MYIKNISVERLYIVFVLSALATVAEGVGITLLLPLLEVLDIGVDSDVTVEKSRLLKGLHLLLDFLGIESSIIGILFFIACVFLLKGLIVFASSAYQSHLKAQLMYELKRMVFELYSKMNYAYYSSHNTGHFVNIINAQVNTLIGSFENYKQFLTVIVTTIVYLSMASLLAWKFAVMGLVSGLLFLSMFRRLNNYTRVMSRERAIEQGTLTRFLVQTIQSFKYLVSTAQLAYFSSQIGTSIKKITDIDRKQGIAQSLTSSLSEPISIIFILFVIMIQVSVFDASLPPIFVALILFNRAMGSIFGVQSVWQSLMIKIGSLEIVESEISNLKENQEFNGDVAIGLLEKNIVLQDVCFSYGKKFGDVLKNINLKIPVNSTVAFVGESGAGKSTLVDILTLMLKTHKGDILFDGVSSRNVDLSSWRKQIGYVSQETVIFDDTIANNICLWQGNYNSDISLRKRIEASSEQAYALEFINELPQGFNTVVGDRGVLLSGGQKQRLFLARELFKAPRLLILDEATSALDSRSEYYIQKSLEVLKGRTTVVLIAHRLSTIKHADIIYVLSKGEIVEQGTYRDLSTDNSTVFSKMVSLQNL